MDHNAKVGSIARVRHFMQGEDVAIVSHAVNAPTSLHVHEFFEIVYVEHGALLHRYGPSITEVRAGDLFIVNPTIPHGYDLTPVGPAHIWNVLVTENALNYLTIDGDTSPMIREIAGYDRNPLEYCRLSLPPDIRANVDRAVKEMYREYQGKRPGYKGILRGHLAIIVGLISRAMSESGERATGRGRASFSGIGHLTRYIVEHCDQPLSVEDLARRGGWSADHMSRLMKKLTGDTVQEYIGRVRAARAARLLITEDSTVEEVARRVGYGDARAFRRAFKRYYGVSPAEMRRRVHPLG